MLARHPARRGYARKPRGLGDKNGVRDRAYPMRPSSLSRRSLAYSLEKANSPSAKR